MSNARVMGICSMIFGLLLAVDGAITEPARWWRAGAGVALIVVGVMYLLRSRRAARPTA